MDASRTRKLKSGGGPESGFFERFSASLVLVSGGAEGSEYTLEKPSTTLGRGPDVDLPFPDDAMSRQHAAFEVQVIGMRLRDLGSTNGTLVNGQKISAAELKHGDKITIGEHCFQYVIEERARAGRAFKVH
jgi:pSer/pThr/pTyr-binding forkhead associated (FHA) protein